MKVLRANLFWALFAGVGLGCQTLADSRLRPLSDANPAMLVLAARETADGMYRLRAGEGIRHE